MNNYHATGRKSTGTTREQTANQQQCPRCGQGIQSASAKGPGLQQFGPCGCVVPQNGGTEVLDEARLVTDGGRAYPEWRCTDCWWPVSMFGPDSATLIHVAEREVDSCFGVTARESTVIGFCPWCSSTAPETLADLAPASAQCVLADGGEVRDISERWPSAAEAVAVGDDVREGDGEDEPRVLTDGGEDIDDPLERLYESRSEDGMVQLKPSELDESEFREALTVLADAGEAIDSLANDAAMLRNSGLDERDIRDLLYGRNSSLTKGTIDTVLETLAEVASAGPQTREDLLTRLVADLGNLTLRETEQVVGDLSQLHERYPPETDDDDDIVTDGGFDEETDEERLHAALLEVDGIGPASALTLCEEFGSLRDLCADIRIGQSVRVARLDGFSPNSAERIRDGLKDAGHWIEPEAMTDGGHEEVLIRRGKNRRDVYHLPDSEEPSLSKCFDQLTGEKGFKRVEKRFLREKFSCCRYCSGEYEPPRSTGSPPCQALKELGRSEEDVEIRTDGGVVIPDTDPSEMSIEELRAEYGNYDVHEMDSESPAWERHLELWREMETRPEADFPACPECGARRWRFTPGGPCSCAECGSHPSSGRAEERVHEAADRLISGVSDDE